MAKEVQPRHWRIFLASVFFVLGFSIVFSVLGVLLQSVLADIAPMVQTWLGRIGGVIIILFGLFLLDLISIPYLERQHTLKVKTKFHSTYLTSFVFGAAFAVGWTPCVGAVLGAILTLAVTQPTSSFFLMLAYSIGLGIPFLFVGLFANQAQQLIQKSMKWLKYVQYVFGLILIALGILVFTQQLSRIANLQFVSTLLVKLNVAGAVSMSGLNIGIAFFAGFVSFLSPCVLPLIPGFLSYLASVSVQK